MRIGPPGPPIVPFNCATCRVNVRALELEVPKAIDIIPPGHRWVTIADERLVRVEPCGHLFKEAICAVLPDGRYEVTLLSPLLSATDWADQESERVRRALAAP